MMSIQTLVIKIGVTIFLIFITQCSDRKVEESIFSETIEKIISTSIKNNDFRPPTFEEFVSDSSRFRTRKVDSSKNNGKLKVNIDKFHIKFDYNSLDKILPKEFKFLKESSNEHYSYVPKKVENFTTTTYELRFVHINNNDIEILNKENLFGGYFQFSKITFNKRKSKGAVFVRMTQSASNSIEKIILFKKVDEQWVIFSQIGVSFS